MLRLQPMKAAAVEEESSAGSRRAGGNIVLGSMSAGRFLGPDARMSSQNCARSTVGPAQRAPSGFALRVGVSLGEASDRWLGTGFRLGADTWPCKSPVRSRSGRAVLGQSPCRQSRLSFTLS